MDASKSIAPSRWLLAALCLVGVLWHARWAFVWSQHGTGIRGSDGVAADGIVRQALTDVGAAAAYLVAFVVIVVRARRRRPARAESTTPRP